jgi:hypothetical protein
MWVEKMSDTERPNPKDVSRLPRLEASGKRERAARRLRAILTEMHKGGEKFGEEEVEADLQKAVEAVRHGRRT